MKNLIRKILQKYSYDICRFEKQIKKSSTDGCFEFFKTLTGNYYLPNNCPNDAIAKAIKQNKLFDENIIAEIKKWVNPGTSILDIGANYGQMTVVLSKLFPDCDIHSFEAQKMVFDLLKKNVKANDCPNTKLYFNAIFDKDGIDIVFPEPDLVKFPTYGSYGIDLKAKEGNKVRSLKIDSVPFEKPISFMKIDIQGCDLFALRGAVETIKKYQMPILFEYEEDFQEDFGTSFQDYVDFVDEIGYKFLRTVDKINYLIIPK